MPRHFITVDDIREWPKEKPVLVPPDGQLTPEALDFSRDRGLTVIYQKSENDDEIYSVVVETLKKKGITDPKMIETILTESLKRIK